MPSTEEDFMIDSELSSSLKSIISSSSSSSSLGNNELVQFIDFLLPFTSIPIDIVREIIGHYQEEKKSRSLLHGDSLQVWEESLSNISSYYPIEYQEIISPMINLLAEKSQDGKLKFIKLLDLLILLTILCHGKLREKSQLLFSFFAANEPEGMLEWEHSQLIQRVSTCLKKIGAIKGSEISVADANYLAFLARIKEGRRGFHLSLSFNDFFHWIQHSPETAPAFLFFRLINRLLRICQTLHQRMDTLSSLLSEITGDNYSSQTIGVPKLSMQFKFIPICPYLLFLTDKSAHFIIQQSSTPTSISQNLESYFLQIDTIHPLSQSSFSFSKIDQTSTSCCERYYTTTTRQQVSPIYSCDLSTLRLDVTHQLSPDTQYLFTFYTSSGYRFPVLSTRTKPHQTMLTSPTFTSHKSMIMIHPSSFTLDRLKNFLQSLPDLDSMNDLLTIFTGCIFPNPEKVIHQISSIFSSYPFDEKEKLPFLLSQLQDLINSFMKSSWLEAQDSFLNSFPQTNLAVDGFVHYQSGSRQMLAHHGWRSLHASWTQNIKQPFSPLIFNSLQEILMTNYLQYTTPYLSPVTSLDKGHLRIYFIRPTNSEWCGITPEEVVTEMQYLNGLPNSSTGNQLLHIMLIIQSPKDLMKHSSQWHEDDSPQVSQALENQHSSPLNTKQEPKLRGRHELIHGAYSTNPTVTFSVPASDNSLLFPHQNEIRRGGDKIFNSLIRSLNKWISLTPPGRRQVSLISTGWVNGVDFALSLDGKSDYIIAHHSLECTVEKKSQLLPTDQELLDRIQLSFNEQVSLEISPEFRLPRSISISISPGIDYQFIPHLQDPSSQISSSTVEKFPAIHLLDSKITQLSHNSVTIELKLKGRGGISCDLYEVPIMATTNDVMRLIETELSLMLLTQQSSHEIDSQSDISMTFNHLTSYCSYAIYIHPSSISDTSTPISPQQVVHFRTYLHEERHATTTLLAALSDEECLHKTPCEIFTRLTSELDCYTRPTAAPLQFIHADIRLFPNTFFHSRYSQTSRSTQLSSEFLSLRRKTHVIQSGFFDDYWERNEKYPIPLPSNLPHNSPPPSLYFDYERITEYETQHGGIDVSFSSNTYQFSLQLNTRKSLRSLLDTLALISDRPTIRCLQIFSSKPLIPHSENRFPSHDPCLNSSLEDYNYLFWEKSKHFIDSEYNLLVIELIERLLKWKESSPFSRDCQIITMAHTPEVVVSYLHRSNQFYYLGFRHFILPITLGLSSSEERIVFPSGVSSFPSSSSPTSSSSSSLVQYSVTSFQYQNNLPPTDLPTYNPFHFIPPLYALHGTRDDDDLTSRYLTRPIYRLTLFTESLIENREVAQERYRSVGFHHDFVIKQIVHDVDSLEVTLGPIVGNVTYTTCGILFEMNRRVDRLQCLLRPVDSPEKSLQITLPSDSFRCMKYDFQGLASGVVYEIFLPEIHGTTILGKFRTLSTRSMYSEVLFLGEESLEYFPVTQRILSDLASQQVLSFNLIGLESSLKTKLQSIASQISLKNSHLDGNKNNFLSHELPYRRPWNSVRSKMKEISCPSSVVIHIGSHALLCRIFREIIPSLIEMVKKYRLDDEQFLQTSALSTFYQLQLVQIIEDSLRVVWIMEPAVKEVFQSSANIALYNSEYWLNEDIMNSNQSGETSRDFLAFNIIRKHYEEGLQKYIYSLRDWNNRSYHHFFQWREGSMVIAALDFASEQMGTMNKNKLKRIQSLQVSESRQEKELLLSEGKGKGKGKGEGKEQNATKNSDDVNDENNEAGGDGDGGGDDGGDGYGDDDLELEEIKALTFTADFMSENQWKHLRQILTDKSINQLVICSQHPLIPLEMLVPDENGDMVIQSTTSTSSSPSQTWKPTEGNIIKLFEQFFKWLVPKKSLEHYKNLTIVCSSAYSYVTNIQDIKSGMKIQQICLGKFSCIPEAHKGLNYDLPSYQLTGKLGGMRYAHRVCGLDAVVLDSSRSGGGGRYSGSMAMWHQPGDAVYGMLRYWFDSWKAIGTCNFFPIHPTGPPEELLGKEAILLVGPIVGAPYLRTTTDGSKMMIPILLEVDRDVSMTMIATELFSGKQMTLTIKLIQMKPTLIRIGPLQLDSRYTLEFIEGIQNSHAFKFVLQTFLNWNDTNIVTINATPQEDPSKNSSEFIRDIIKRFQVPFHGLTTVLHTDVEVDVKAILEEAQTQSDLQQMLYDALHSSTPAIHSRLREYVKQVMNRIRAEYRMYLSRPSYRELLLRAFNLFMLREDEAMTFFEDDELFLSQHGATGSLISLLNLIVSRVRQEYFDQFLFPEDRLYAAWPRIRRTKEMIQDEDLRKTLQSQNGIVMRGNMMVLTADNCHDEEILKYPRPRQPDRMYSDPLMDPIDCVLEQWLKDLIPSPALWQTWISPNKKLSIEKLCSDSDHNIKEMYERIFNDKITASCRLLVLPSVGNLFDQENRVGYKLQDWIRHWISDDPSRSISLFCPSRANEGTYLYSIDYSLPSVTSGQLVIQFLTSIFSSNQKEIQKLQNDKLLEMKKKLSSKGAVSGRRAIAKRKEEEQKLKEEIQLELNELLNQLTPDGYVIYETKYYQQERGEGQQAQNIPIVTTALRCLSSRDEAKDNDSTGQSSRPTYYDYISLPNWFIKFCPCTPGVFVQDEVILMIRQDLHYKEFLTLLEEDVGLFQEYKKSYESSRLSELSRPVDLREVDMTVPGIIEMFLENVIEKIWNDVLPSPLKGKLFTMTDDFIRSYCLSRAFADLQVSLSSSLSFAKAMRSMVFSCALLFLACKMATGAESSRWEFILNTREFPEDRDEEIKKNSDDEDSEEEEEEGDGEGQEGEGQGEKEENEEDEEGNGGKGRGRGGGGENKTGGGGETTSPAPLSRDEIILQLQQNFWEITQKRIQRRRRYGEVMSYMSSSQYI